MLRAAIALGGNLGDRERHLREARDAIAALDEVRLVASSRLYDTEPLLLPGAEPQPRYLNAAIAIDTSLAPLALLDALLSIEQQLGRVRRERWGARTIDLDLLWAEEDGAPITLDTPRLTLPHPRLSQRAFALAPLLDVLPHLSARYARALEEAGGAPASRPFDAADGAPATVKG